MNEKLRELFVGQSVAIAGFGVEGQAAYQLLQNIDCDITIIDENTDTDTPQNVISHLGEGWLDEIADYDVVLRTSGMHPNKLEAAKHIVTSTDLMLDMYSRQTIALTGTKGKTTTVKLTAELLRSADVSVELVGNVGRSAWEVLATGIDSETVIVAELSSFQLSDVRHSPYIAGLLSITDDHLDWHKDKDDYYDSKLNLIRFQSEMDTAIADKKVIDDLNIVKLTSAVVKLTDAFITQEPTKLTTSTGHIPIKEIKLKGQHNMDDIKLAVSLTAECLHKRGESLSSHWKSIRRTITAFEPLKFHVEELGFIDGSRVVNDSHGSNPTATLAALQAVSGNKVLIMGGHTKGFEFNDLMNALDERGVESVVIIGADATHCQTLADLVQHHSSARVDIVGEQEMDTILNRALQLADERTTILFSPAHASFDMYTNFTERGKLFTEAVQNHEGFRATS